LYIKAIYINANSHNFLEGLRKTIILRLADFRADIQTRGYQNTETYSPKARIVESHLLAVTRKRPVNKEGMVFSAQAMPYRAQRRQRNLLMCPVKLEIKNNSAGEN
jgi:hypothetical protein